MCKYGGWLSVCGWTRIAQSLTISSIFIFALPNPHQTLKRRYFLLRKKALMYFEGENAAIDSSLGKIVLSAALSVVKAPIDPEEPMSKYGFMVCHHHLVYCDYCRLF